MMYASLKTSLFSLVELHAVADRLALQWTCIPMKGLSPLQRISSTSPLTTATKRAEDALLHQANPLISVYS